MSVRHARGAGAQTAGRQAGGLGSSSLRLHGTQQACLAGSSPRLCVVLPLELLLRRGGRRSHSCIHAAHAPPPPPRLPGPPCRWSWSISNTLQPGPHHPPPARPTQAPLPPLPPPPLPRGGRWAAPAFQLGGSMHQCVTCPLPTHHQSRHNAPHTRLPPTTTTTMPPPPPPPPTPWPTTRRTRWPFGRQPTTR